MGQWPASGAGLHAWVDASAGVGGDMLLGALLDAGASLEDVRRCVDAVLPDTVHITTSQVTRAGLRATRAEVSLGRPDQPHRAWREIRELLTRAELPDRVRQRAVATFAALAAAEARVHGTDAEAVEFHEVGAWDSVADVVGVCAALESLPVEGLTAGPVALGSGRTTGTHGDLPVPVPAVLELARGWQVLGGGDGELATPTGLALVRTLASTCEQLPPMEVAAVGVGAGTRDPSGRANVVRVVVGTKAGSGAGGSESLWLLEANVDDLDPRVWPSVLQALLAAGAADAWLTPVLMKKGRPAHTVSVLCRPVVREVLRDCLFRQTSTLGIREHAVERSSLRREWHRVAVGDGEVRVKVSVDAECVVVHATPEFEDVRALAEAAGVPVRLLLEEAAAAAHAAGLRPGATVRRATDGGP